MHRRLPILTMLLSLAAHATDDADRAREEAQRALNEHVIAQPFNPGDVRKAQAYAEQAKKEGVKPVAVAPTHWQPGWSCSNLTVHPAYAYADYRNCVYYFHVYGRYWR
ncbi:MAG: hypothetical protein HZC37_16260 [Burkholderiales bacterium]|nr:hypothetical protein [Burkholderiales bacterium]